AALPAGPAPAPAAAVRDAIARELGRPPGAVFAGFEGEPCERGLLFQAHRAWLHGGEPVTVKLADPGPAGALDADLDALPLLRGALAGGEGPELPLGGAAADFRQWVRQQADCARE